MRSLVRQAEEVCSRFAGRIRTAGGQRTYLIHCLFALHISINLVG